MLFNTFEFLVFFLVTTSLYFLLEHKYRWVLLLLASCIFYMYFIPIYILILFFTIIIDYYAGIWIEKSTGQSRKTWLVVSLISNIGILAVFKYYNFFIENINSVISDQYHLSILSIVLPVGLSFHTFQAMSYTIEVYRGNQKAERHFGIYSLYVMFYPQLVAGPIERPQNIIHQFYTKKKFEIDRIISGLKLILFGLFKKVVIADRLAIVVDEVYKQPDAFSGIGVLIAAIFFSIQIYCDFSGYSDIAIGSARVLGIDLMKNFNSPYFALSISEFWTKWHISLSTWFKDYLYIPLGGNRVKPSRMYFNLMVVFVVSGFWHGANWNFIIWGAIHGIVLILSTLSIFKIKVLPNWFKWLITFSIVTLAWVFFRAENLNNALLILKKMTSIQATDYFSLVKADLHGLPPTILNMPFWKFIAVTFLIPLLFIADYVVSKGLIKKYITKPVFRHVFYSVIILLIFVFGVFETNQFIYFQF